MAYFNQEDKAAMAPGIKAICKKYNVKASLAVRNHSTVCLNIKQGAIDFIGNCNKVSEARAYGREWRKVEKSLDVNPYHYQDHFDGKALKFLSEVFAVLRGPDFFDHSDIQTDYFNCSHYIDVNIGQWNKPYILN